MGYYDVDKFDSHAPSVQSTPPAGFGDVSEYLVSSAPWANSTSVTSGTTISYQFPNVTRFIHLANHGSASQFIKLGFVFNGVVGSNYIKLFGGQDIRLDLRVKEAHIRSDDVLSSSISFSLAAGLTSITASSAPDADRSDSPTFAPSPGVYTVPQSVIITGPPGSTIYYTLDGSTPTLGSNFIASGGTVKISGTKTLKVISSVSGFNLSNISSGVYTTQIFLYADFKSLAPGGIAAGASPGSAFENATGLRFVRSTPGTVQTGLNTIDSTPGIDVARIGRRNDTDAFGLVIEESRLNTIASSRNALVTLDQAGSGYSGSQNFAAGPDGQVLADRVVVASGGYSNYAHVTRVSGTYVSSIWKKASSAGMVGSGSQMQLNPPLSSPPTSNYCTQTLAATWQRGVRIWNTAASSLGGYLPDDGRNQVAEGGLPAGARDCVIDFMQDEQGTFETEAIVTTGAAASRAFDRLFHPTGSQLLVNGSVRFETSFRPKGSFADYPGLVSRIWTGIDSGIQAFIANTTHQLVVASNGSTFLVFPVAMSWAKNDLLDLWMVVGNGVPLAKYRVNGGPAIDLGNPSGSFGPLTSPSTFEFFSDGSDSALSVRVMSIAMYGGSFSPAWAV